MLPASLTGEGVVLRTWSPADAGSIAAVCGDPEICNWSSLPWTPDTGALLAWIERQRQVHAAGRRLSMAITVAGLDAAVGWVGLSPRSGEPDVAALGYWIVPAARRRGLTLAAAHALADWAFDTGYAERILIHFISESPPFVIHFVENKYPFSFARNSKKAILSGG